MARLAPLEYQHPRKYRSKSKGNCYLQSVFPVQKPPFSACMQRRVLFFFGLISLSILHHMALAALRRGWITRSLLHDTAGRWMRGGGPGGRSAIPICLVGPRTADKMESNNAKKSEKGRTCVRYRYRHALVYFFFQISR